MTQYKTYKPEGISDPYGTYVHGIEPPVGSRMVFVSGQIPVAFDGTVPETMEGQATVCWQNIEATLKAAGLGIENIVRTTQYLTDASMYPEANAVRAKMLGTHRTASVSITVPALIEPTWLIEIDAIAAAPAE
ncbi:MULTISPECIES: RidA family protein [unclassified Oceanobacter]|jgi:enamine deaminase RidA (YjgF/YER057c/UK114 family)|uniref:RidA family protein n=1 Tax=unclassified Oceanobacter TaxID=2620260 RepID=UPI0026E13525|nr:MULTISPECIES: RidA family protein [unclassified Oceanobacter]MDO6683383.1 RidA family protein [Oceanobacter sp. 5_MG-2023]MDP2505933.1 RidA family protein [Oceanobacter sp. 3_MG-2023]MDP2547814.1 RidA family protein [Oceanobacter sp. 4_MG-2023]MDP2608411.1 RidA family protein [Oceanobacter sp. 1_MG-2023]MDP2611506.1 RidA family protein [Oceanobacter sp. 2_MG-2023]